MKRYITLILLAVFAISAVTLDAKPRSRRATTHRHYKQVLTKGGDVVASEYGTAGLEGHWIAPTGGNKADEEFLEIRLHGKKASGRYEGHFMRIEHLDGAIHGTALRMTGYDEETGGYLTLLFRLTGPDELEMAGAEAYGVKRFHRARR